MKKIFLLLAFIGIAMCGFAQLQFYKGPIVTDSSVVTGARQIDKYLPLLKGKRVVVVANPTSAIGKTHLVDTLLASKVNIVKIFAPEHGFRGKGDAGEHLDDMIDTLTGLPVVSLYGKKAKPDSAQLNGVDVVLFDIQDVGARFYTYISTLHNIMEACGENKTQLILLDRPNPNGFYVDGPILDTVCRSFVGLHQVPIVHGMTIGEYANMINGEKWLKDSVQCNLTVIACQNWDHTQLYQLPIAPSPNLKTMQSVYLYPSLCLFEGTNVSVGRGTFRPFEMYGNPYLQNMTYAFTPRSMAGSKKPMFIDKLCYGESLHYEIAEQGAAKFTLAFLKKAYANMPAGKEKDRFFVSNGFFEKLCGRTDLQEQIKKDMAEDDLRNIWQPGIDTFKSIRKKYLLYKDFE